MTEQIITKTMRNEKHLHDTMKAMSIESGGAVVARRIGFSFDFEFSTFKNPSSVPDAMFDLVRREMAHNGQMRGFTPGAIRRESQRGLRRD